MSINFNTNNKNNAYDSMLDMMTKSAVESPVSGTEIASVRVGDITDETDTFEKKRGGHKGLIGLSIGTTALLFIVAAFTLPKGFSGGFYKKIARWSDGLKKKAFELSTNAQNLTTKQKLSLYLSKSAEPIADGMEAMSNFNAVKDGGITQIAKKIGLMPVFNKISGFFKNICEGSIVKAYSKAGFDNIRFTEYVRKIAQKDGNTELLKLVDDINTKYESLFSTRSHYTRSQHVWNSMKNLHDDVWNAIKEKNGKSFLKKFKTYLTMEKSEHLRKPHIDALFDAKKIISNGIEDNYKALRHNLNNIKINIKTNDEKAVELAHNLSKDIDVYRSLSGTKEAAERAQISKLINKKLDMLLEHLQIANGADSAKEISAAVENFKNILNPELTKKGKGQEIITIIKNQYGKKSPEYKAAVNYLEKMNDSLTDAIKVENSAYEKFAELRVGSAPTDVLGIFVPITWAMYMVGKSKTSDEKVSEALTKGIPILGGIATSYYGTVRGFTGPKNMAIGLTTGALLNLIGTSVDSLYQRYRAGKIQLSDTLAILKKYQEKYEPLAVELKSTTAIKD